MITQDRVVAEKELIRLRRTQHEALVGSGITDVVRESLGLRVPDEAVWIVRKRAGKDVSIAELDENEVVSESFDLYPGLVGHLACCVLAVECLLPDEVTEQAAQPLHYRYVAIRMPVVKRLEITPALPDITQEQALLVSQSLATKLEMNTSIGLNRELVFPEPVLLPENIYLK